MTTMSACGRSAGGRLEQPAQLYRLYRRLVRKGVFDMRTGRGTRERHGPELMTRRGSKRWAGTVPGSGKGCRGTCKTAKVRNVGCDGRGAAGQQGPKLEADVL